MTDEQDEEIGIVGTWSECCQIFRNGKVDPRTVHTAACYIRRTERGADSNRYTYYLGIVANAEKKT